MPKTITIEISDDDLLVLENDLLDVDDWVQKAVEGKINNCKKRMVREWQPKLFADPAVESIPAKEDKFLELVVARPDYKNRAARETVEEE